jgi:hypothetical protein
MAALRGIEYDVKNITVGFEAIRRDINIANLSSRNNKFPSIYELRMIIIPVTPPKMYIVFQIFQLNEEII